MEKNDSAKVYQEYVEDFGKMTDAELMGAFNRQVGSGGWIGRKITYFCALQAELKRRNIQTS